MDASPEVVSMLFNLHTAANGEYVNRTEGTGKPDNTENISESINNQPKEKSHDPKRHHPRDDGPDKLSTEQLLLSSFGGMFDVSVKSSKRRKYDGKAKNDAQNIHSDLSSLVNCNRSTERNRTKAKRSRKLKNNNHELNTIGNTEQIKLVDTAGSIEKSEAGRGMPSCSVDAVGNVNSTISVVSFNIVNTTVNNIERTSKIAYDSQTSNKECLETGVNRNNTSLVKSSLLTIEGDNSNTCEQNVNTETANHGLPSPLSVTQPRNDHSNVIIHNKIQECHNLKNYANADFLNLDMNESSRTPLTPGSENFTSKHNRINNDQNFGTCTFDPCKDLPQYSEGTEVTKSMDSCSKIAEIIPSSINTNCLEVEHCHQVSTSLRHNEALNCVEDYKAAKQMQHQLQDLSTASKSISTVNLDKFNSTYQCEYNVYETISMTELQKLRSLDSCGMNSEYYKPSKFMIPHSTSISKDNVQKPSQDFGFHVVNQGVGSPVQYLGNICRKTECRPCYKSQQSEHVRNMQTSTLAVTNLAWSVNAPLFSSGSISQCIEKEPIDIMSNSNNIFSNSQKFSLNDRTISLKSTTHSAYSQPLLKSDIAPSNMSNLEKNYYIDRIHASPCKTNDVSINGSNSFASFSILDRSLQNHNMAEQILFRLDELQKNLENLENKFNMFEEFQNKKGLTSKSNADSTTKEQNFDVNIESHNDESRITFNGHGPVIILKGIKQIVVDGGTAKFT